MGAMKVASRNNSSGSASRSAWAEARRRVLAYAAAPAYARALGLKFSEFSLRYAALLRMQTLPILKRRKTKSNDDLE